MVQADLEFMAPVLLQPRGYWGYRCSPSRSAERLVHLQKPCIRTTEWLISCPPTLPCMVTLISLSSRLENCMEEMIRFHPGLHPLPVHSNSSLFHFPLFLWASLQEAKPFWLPSPNKLLKAPNQTANFLPAGWGKHTEILEPRDFLLNWSSHHITYWTRAWVCTHT